MKAIQLIKKFQKRQFFKIINQYENGLKFRFGKYIETYEAGINFYIPLVESIKTVDMSTNIKNINNINLVSEDGVSFKIDASIQYKVTDAKKAFINVSQYSEAIIDRVQMELRGVLTKMKMMGILSSRGSISSDIIEKSKDIIEEWGLTISSVNIKDISFDETVIKSMAYLAESERIAKAKIINAQSDLEAAQIYQKDPNALRLKEITSLQEMARMPNKMIILVPTSIINGSNKEIINTGLNCAIEN